MNLWDQIGEVARLAKEEERLAAAGVAEDADERKDLQARRREFYVRLDPTLIWTP